MVNNPQSLAAHIRDVLSKTEKFSKEDLADYQQSQLRQLLHFTNDNVPFYKERLAPLFRRDGTLDLGNWQQVPILTRTDIKENGDSLMVAQLPKGHTPTLFMASSGTTGTPISLRSSYLMGLAGNAAFDRACGWYGHTDRDRSCVAFGDATFNALDPGSWIIAGKDSSDGQAIERAAYKLAVNQQWSPEKILSLMEQYQTTCFSGYATLVEDLAEAQLDCQSKINMNFMVGVSMALTERARELVGKAFRARAYGAYSSKEAHKMAHECPVSGGFHVNNELMLLEILDDNGVPCGVGETGRVVVTPFLSTAQPLIRYDHGDLAIWGGPCSCGRAHPIISSIAGRVRNRFRFGNGRKFTPAIGHIPYRDLLKAEKWQVAQTGAMDIEIRFVSLADDQTIDFDTLTKVFREAFHKDLNVKYRRVNTMPLTQAGKFIDYVNEWGD